MLNSSLNSISFQTQCVALIPSLQLQIFLVENLNFIVIFSLSAKQMDAGSINYLYSTDIIYETPKANNVLYINYFIHQLGIHGNRKNEISL